MSVVTKPPEPATRGRQTSAPRRRRKPGWWLPYALLAPAVLFEILVHLVPMAIGVWMSFIKLTKFFIANWGEAPVAGWHNFAISLDFNGVLGKSLLQSFLTTCAFTVLAVGLSWVLGMAAAVALQKAFRGRAIFRTLFLVPYALPVYTGVIAWKFMLQKDNGAVNHFLVDNLHLLSDKPFWLLGDNTFVSIVVIAAWRLWPFAFLMLMAGLQSVPQDMYEAAAIDGAKPFRQWTSITLPMLRPVNTVVLLVMFLWTFNDFNVPYVLFGTSEPAGGDLISFHIYNTSFLTWNFGLGAAMSVLLVVFLLIVTGLYLLFVNRRSRRA